MDYEELKKELVEAIEIYKEALLAGDGFCIGFYGEEVKFLISKIYDLLNKGEKNGNND